LACVLFTVCGRMSYRWQWRVAAGPAGAGCRSYVPRPLTCTHRMPPRDPRRFSRVLKPPHPSSSTPTYSSFAGSSSSSPTNTNRLPCPLSQGRQGKSGRPASWPKQLLGDLQPPSLRRRLHHRRPCIRRQSNPLLSPPLLLLPPPLLPSLIPATPAMVPLFLLPPPHPAAAAAAAAAVPSRPP